MQNNFSCACFSSHCSLVLCHCTQCHVFLWLQSSNQVRLYSTKRTVLHGRRRRAYLCNATIKTFGDSKPLRHLFKFVNASQVERQSEVQASAAAWRASLDRLSVIHLEWAVLEVAFGHDGVPSLSFHCLGAFNNRCTCWVGRFWTLSNANTITISTSTTMYKQLKIFNAPSSIILYSYITILVICGHTSGL